MWQEKNNSRSINHSIAATPLSLAASKIGLEYQEPDAGQADGEGSYCQYLSRTPNRELIVQNIRSVRMLGNTRWSKTGSWGGRGVLPPNRLLFRLLPLPPCPLKLGEHSGRQIESGENILQNPLIFLLKKIAKKNNPSLTRLLAPQLVAVLASLAAALPALIAIRNASKLHQTARIGFGKYMIHCLLQVASARLPSVC